VYFLKKHIEKTHAIKNVCVCLFKKIIQKAQKTNKNVVFFSKKLLKIMKKFVSSGKKCKKT
jgi:hypothetical protein